MMPPRVLIRLALVTGAIVLAAAGLLLVLRRAEEPVIRAEDLQPPGRWHFQPTDLAAGEADPELARLLSLPYVAGRQPAPAASGVVVHQRELAHAGVNLYVSGHGPEARLIDMDGALLHRWEYSFERAFPDVRETPDTAYFRRAWLYPDGDLLVIFQGGGMVRLDRDSALEWRSELPYFNHVHVAPDGRIFTIAKLARQAPALRADGPILEDFVVVLSPDGEILDRLSLLQCFLGSDFAARLQPLPDHADVFHTNSVELVRQPPPDDSYPFRPGDILVSLREVDIVGFVDATRRGVRMAWRGPWRAQHHPVLLADGHVLLFDNRGLDDRSRVVEFDPRSGELTWEFAGSAEVTIDSPEAGACQRLANGNTLITDSERGRAVEITADGTLAWEFISPHRAGHRGELIATLFDVQRFDRSGLPFLAAAAER